jgi:hypothetical protein
LATIVGVELTVSVAPALQTVEVEFVTHARNCKPLKAVVAASNARLGWLLVGLLDSKATQTLVVFRYCHWIVGVGEPPVVTLKIAVPPTFTVCGVGFVTVGAEFSVSVAGALLQFPTGTTAGSTGTVSETHASSCNLL